MYRIFIVEDDAAIAGVIRRHLEGWGRSSGRIPMPLSAITSVSPSP